MLYWAWLFTNKFFCSGLACLLNKPKTKAQAWLIYKQTNMNEFFIKPSPSCSRSAWFVYSPSLNISFIFFTTSLKYYFFNYFLFSISSLPLPQSYWPHSLPPATYLFHSDFDAGRDLSIKANMTMSSSSLAYKT